MLHETLGQLYLNIKLKLICAKGFELFSSTLILYAYLGVFWVQQCAHSAEISVKKYPPC